jgi:hypothetical protein
VGHELSDIPGGTRGNLRVEPGIRLVTRESDSAFSARGTSRFSSEAKITELKATGAAPRSKLIVRSTPFNPKISTTAAAAARPAAKRTATFSSRQFRS